MQNETSRYSSILLLAASILVAAQTFGSDIDGEKEKNRLSPTTANQRPSIQECLRAFVEIEATAGRDTSVTLFNGENPIPQMLKSLEQRRALLNQERAQQAKYVLQFPTPLEIQSPLAPVVGEPHLCSVPRTASGAEVAKLARLLQPHLSEIHRFDPELLPQREKQDLASGKETGEFLKAVAQEPGWSYGDPRQVFSYATVSKPRKEDLDFLLGKTILGSTSVGNRQVLFGGIVEVAFTTLYKGRIEGWAVIRDQNNHRVTVPLNNSKLDLNEARRVGFLVYDIKPEELDSLELVNAAVPSAENPILNRVPAEGQLHFHSEDRQRIFDEVLGWVTTGIDLSKWEERDAATLTPQFFENKVFTGVYEDQGKFGVVSGIGEHPTDTDKVTYQPAHDDKQQLSLLKFRKLYFLKKK